MSLFSAVLLCDVYISDFIVYIHLFVLSVFLNLYINLLRFMPDSFLSLSVYSQSRHCKRIEMREKRRGREKTHEGIK